MKESKYHELSVDLRNCNSERELLRVATYIQNNKKKLQLDESDIERLQSIGISRYEALTRERNAMIKNKKQGFNNFGD
jgi:uncharacterized protein YjiS (DUF1127 family)